MTPSELHVDVLMKEYTAMREEVLLHFRNAKLHLKHFQAFIALILAVASYLFFSSDADRVGKIISLMALSKVDVAFFAIFALDMVSFYFAFDILDSYFCMYLAAARLANIEKQINAETKKNTLIWESRFQSTKVATLGFSRVLITVYQLVLVAIIGVWVPFFCYTQLEAHKLERPWMVATARGAALACFAVFLISFIDVFFVRPGMARRTIDRIVDEEGQGTDGRKPQR